MSKRKKKEHHEEHVDESWLIPYADILTLLLALFIVLFAMSSVDARKFEALSKAFNDAFNGGTGFFDFPSPMPDGAMQSADKADTENKDEVEKASAAGTLEEGQNDMEAEGKIQKLTDKQELKEVEEKVKTYIQNNGLKDKLETSLTDEGLLVTIRDNVFFASGSAEVRSGELTIADEIGELLVMDPPRNIIISGHTDNMPIKNSEFESNWELSVMRAVNFMKILLHNKDLDARAFSAKGFGEFQPAASNDTKEGRDKNRRVEILILPRT
ncbi:flagellar motor protein MotB [Bacillus infantis]|uniref:flagellar motor protein MotB n=1 Tax=Bacillus infantis TaxID=324767 RepID=UPI00209E8EB1|nr:flagellar motor protein MotB [Bacillus infantis]MCP1156924.1 flagellar motor protein MotB [Bacillus infantis]